MRRAAGRPAGGGESFVPGLGLHGLTWLYDPLVALTTRERVFRERLLAQAGLAAGQAVLDLGCGTGTQAILAARRFPGAEVCGIDADPKMIDRARRKAAARNVPVVFERALASDLPFPDARFDRVLSSLFFHHLVRDAKITALAEVRRVLRPGGTIHVADFGRPDNALMRLLFRAVRWVDGAESTTDSLLGLLPDLLAGAGFEAVEETGTMGTVFGTVVFHRARRPIDR